MPFRTLPRHDYNPLFRNADKGQITLNNPPPDFITALANKLAALDKWQETIEAEIREASAKEEERMCLDFVTKMPMVDPYQDNNGHTLDLSTWQHMQSNYQKNPFDRSVIDLTQLTPNNELKARIEERDRSRFKRAIDDVK